MSETKKGPLTVRALPWTLLALSLALNAFFIGGHVYTDARLEQAEASGTERARLVAERLELDPDQAAAFRTMRSRVETARQDYEVARSRHAEVIWDELAAPEPDMEAVDEHLDRFWDNRKTLLMTNLSAARDFLGRLSHDQRREFISLSRQAEDAPIGIRVRER